MEGHTSTLYPKQTTVLPPLLSDRVPVLREGRLPVVGIGKHLCGVATGKAAGHTVTSALAQGAGACMAPPPRAVCALIELT